MNLSRLLTIASLAVGAALLPAAVEAQPGPPPGHGADRPPPGPARAWHEPPRRWVGRHHSRRVCRTVWHDHHRVRRCWRR